MAITEWDYDARRYASSYSNHTLTMYSPEIEIDYGHTRNEITIRGRFETGDSGRRFYLNEFTAQEEKPTVFPGSLTMCDANGNAITIEPTGQNGYTVHTTPEPVRVNSRMQETIQNHINRCLNYNKPKPVAELEG